MTPEEEVQRNSDIAAWVVAIVTFLAGRRRGEVERRERRQQHRARRLGGAPHRPMDVGMAAHRHLRRTGASMSEPRVRRPAPPPFPGHARTLKLPVNPPPPSPPMPFAEGARPMTEPVGQSPKPLSAEEEALMREQLAISGMYWLGPASIERLFTTLDAARSATVRPPGDEAGLRAFARTLALESIPHEWGPGAQRHRRHVLRLLDDALATTPESAYANGRAALAAKPDPEGPGLDAERLRQALDAHMAAFVEQPESYDSSAAVAASIAAEYARLANPDREEPADG